MAQEVGSQSPFWFFPIHQLVAHATLPLSPPEGHITCLFVWKSPEKQKPREGKNLSKYTQQIWDQMVREVNPWLPDPGIEPRSPTLASRFFTI